MGCAEDPGSPGALPPTPRDPSALPRSSEPRPGRPSGVGRRWAGLAGTGVLGSEEMTSLGFLPSGPSGIKSGVLYFPLTCSNS